MEVLHLSVWKFGEITCVLGAAPACPAARWLHAFNATQAIAEPAPTNAPIVIGGIAKSGAALWTVRHGPTLVPVT